jgi:ribonuclease HI
MAAREHPPKPGSRIVCTDGSGNAKTKFGSWAFVVMNGDEIAVSRSAGAYPTTNNLMELEAVIQALTEFKGIDVHIVSDSRYVIDGITEWIYGWRKKGWVNGKDEPVKNRESWERLWALVEHTDVTFEHTRGHRKHVGNNAADKLCSITVAKFEEEYEVHVDTQ